MKRIFKLFQPVKQFILRYPAVLAAYLIYGYYFISTMEFYINFRNKHFTAADTFGHYDTLLWMWILAYALVKVIDLREKLHQRETDLMEREHHIALKETQIKTLHEVIMTLKHEINNPLSIVLGYTRLLKKNQNDDDTAKKLKEIENSSVRIHKVLQDFSETSFYETSPSVVGPLVERSAPSPEKNNDPA